MPGTDGDIGVVVGGSLTKGLEVRLDAAKAAGLGQYVMAPLGDGFDLLGMVTDVMLKSAEGSATAWPPPSGEDRHIALLREVLLDTGVYTAIDVQPYLEVGEAGESSRARRIPRHFARVARADQDALTRAFDVGDDRPAVTLGSPLGMDDVMVHVDLEKLFERSAGIFGKSGTGKTVYAVQFLSGLIKQSSMAPTKQQRTVALIFDMHDDYGDYLKFEGGQRRSLKLLHGSDVALMGVEDRPGLDRRLVVGTKDIEPDDLRVLQSTAEFTQSAIEACDVLFDKLGHGWFDAVLAEVPPAALARASETEEGDAGWGPVLKSLDIAQPTWTHLRRKLRALKSRDFVQSGDSQFRGAIDWIVQSLQGGQSVVIQFGKHGNNLTSYMLVANMLSRRIWDAYQRAMEQARGDAAKEPNRLVIVIEEAHKFVDKSMAGQTIFGEIARELRKYNVTLLIIDQRPSQIDPEVLSQIGTKFCLQLDSEADVEALVGGIQGRSGLRQVIASLESKQQALVFGHALPMPVMVRPPEFTRDFAPGGSLRQRLDPGANGAASAAMKPLYG